MKTKKERKAIEIYCEEGKANWVLNENIFGAIKRAETKAAIQ